MKTNSLTFPWENGWSALPLRSYELNQDFEERMGFRCECTRNGFIPCRRCGESRGTRTYQKYMKRLQAMDRIVWNNSGNLLKRVIVEISRGRAVPLILIVERMINQRLFHEILINTNHNVQPLDGLLRKMEQILRGVEILQESEFLLMQFCYGGIKPIQRPDIWLEPFLEEEQIHKTQRLLLYKISNPSHGRTFHYVVGEEDRLQREVNEENNKIMEDHPGVFFI